MAEGHKHPRYWLILIILAVATLVEVLAARLMPEYMPDWKVMTVVILVALAFGKAAIVGLYFMHLITERIAFICIVSFPLVLALVLVVALFPDVVFRFQ